MEFSEMGNMPGKTLLKRLKNTFKKAIVEGSMVHSALLWEAALSGSLS